MWIVAKYKNNELGILKENFIKVLGNSTVFYNPKIKFQKFVKNKLKTYEKFVLENYLICHSAKFSDPSFINRLKYSKGISYFLNGFRGSQNEISNFVQECKRLEDENGYLTQDFFEILKNKKARFISGPFTDIMFEVISNQKNKLRVLIGNLRTTISKKSGYLYRSI